MPQHKIISVGMNNANQVLENWARDGWYPISIAHQPFYTEDVTILLKKDSTVEAKDTIQQVKDQ